MSIVLNCLHPVRVRNPYTGKELFVPCRRCVACRNARALTLKTRIDSEFNVNPNALFITLKYDNSHLPVLHPVHVDNRNGYFVKSITSSNVDYISSYFVHPDVSSYPDLDKIDNQDLYIPSSNIKKIIRPVGYDDPYSIAVVSKIDVIKFFKRLRINLSRYEKKIKKECRVPVKQSSEWKIRYFVSSEYGPTTLRPHYHAIIWFAKEIPRAVLKECIFKSWSLGLIDIKPANRGASSYLSNYVTNHSDLPAFLQTKFTKPFALFSKAPLLGTLPDSRETAREFLVTGTCNKVKSTLSSDGQIINSDYFITRSFIYKYFCVPVGYSRISDSSKLRVLKYLFEYVRSGKSYRYALDKMKVSINPDTGECFKPLDIRSAICCFEWCKELNILPFDYLQLLNRFYLVRFTAMYKSSLETFANRGSLCYLYDYLLIDNLRKKNVSFSDGFVYSFFDSYGLSFDELEKIDFDYTSNHFYGNHKAIMLKIYNDSIKSKKKNDYLKSSFYLRRVKTQQIIDNPF